VVVVLVDLEQTWLVNFVVAEPVQNRHYQYSLQRIIQ
jgi:hypothetical protein